MPPFQQGHFYLGGRAGWAAYQDACGDNALDCSDDTLGYGLYGGYQFNSWFALEGGVTSYGSPEARYSYGDVEVDMWGGEVAAKLGYPLTERLDIYTRLGGAYQRIEKTFSQRPDAVNSSEWNILSSVGLSYRLSQRWSVRGEYQFIDGVGDTDIRQADSHFTSLGVTYHFGQAVPTTPEPKPVMAPVTPSPRYVTVEQAISLSTDSLFDFDSSKIKQPDSLSPFAEQLKAYPDGAIRVVGYTDASGPERYNQRLSEQRAQAVANYLEQQGVASERMTVIGLGESNPVASNETTEGRALNRRVAVLFDTVVQETQEVTETRVEE